MAQNLPSGVYTVQVTDNTTPGNSCLSTATFTVVDAPAVIAIAQTDITLTDQTDCAPANGSAEVTDILVDNAAIGGVAGYTFTWLQNDGTTTIPGSGNAAIIGTSLANGSYFVSATNTTTNCVSPATTVHY